MEYLIGAAIGLFVWEIFIKTPYELIVLIRDIYEANETGTIIVYTDTRSSSELRDIEKEHRNAKDK